MITVLLITSLTITMVFLTMKHPLSMGLMLLAQTITVSLMSGNMTQNFWFSYILFLIMIGGMLILFMYMTTSKKMTMKMMGYLILVYNKILLASKAKM